MKSTTVALSSLALAVALLASAPSAAACQIDVFAEAFCILNSPAGQIAGYAACTIRLVNGQVVPYARCTIGV